MQINAMHHFPHSHIVIHYLSKSKGKLNEHVNEKHPVIIVHVPVLRNTQSHLILGLNEILYTSYQWSGSDTP